MWISSGEHELTENIIHLVLAKIPDADGKLVPGTRGISLFIVPKKLVNIQGELTGVRNDVALAGLNHKLGWRGTTNTLLNFGEREGAGLDGGRHPSERVHPLLRSSGLLQPLLFPGLELGAHAHLHALQHGQRVVVDQRHAVLRAHRRSQPARGRARTDRGRAGHVQPAQPNQPKHMQKQKQ